MLKYDNIHILTSEIDFNYTFLKFFEKHLDYKNSLFVFRSKSRGRIYTEDFKTHIIFIDNFFKLLFTLIPVLYKCKKIYFHFFSASLTLFVWFFFQSLFKKARWCLWGGDLYFYLSSNKSIINTIYERIRKKLIKKFTYIACLVKEDYEKVRDIYQIKANYSFIMYPMPISFADLDKVFLNRSENISKKIEIRIQVGNSADQSNDHIGILMLLQKFQAMPVKLIIPLSYGIKDDYVKILIDKGNEIYQSSFFPIFDYLNGINYVKSIDCIDILVLNHKRQQGLATAICYLYLGKKVFIRSDTTSYQFLKNLGLVVYDTLQIQNMDYAILVKHNPEEGNKNRKIIQKFFSDDNYIKAWKSFLSL